MNADQAMKALNTVLEALKEVQSFDGALPFYDESEPADGQVLTFLDLTKQYAGKRVSEEALVKTIDQVSALFPTYSFAWK